VRRALALLLILAAVSPASHAQIRPPRVPGFQPVEPVETDVEADVIDQTNAFRAAQGLGPLTEHPALTADARAFAQVLAQTGSLSHGADGRDSGERALAVGYRYCDVAENLGYVETSRRGVRGLDVAGDLMRGWEASPSHRRDMLDPVVTQIGVGVARSPRGDRYVAVQVFGRPDSARFPFWVVNQTDQRLSYAFEGHARAIEPGQTAQHWTCRTGPVVFTGAASYPAEPGETFVLSRDSLGRIRIAIQRRGA
jgi:uncharacterized protein YkwD